MKEGTFSQEQKEESKIFNIDPAGTGAVYMEEWTKEYFKNKEYADRKRTKREVVEDLVTEIPELARILESGNISELHDFLDDNPDLLDSMVDDFAYADKPAEKYRRKAIDKMFDDKDYIGTIRLINKGLEFDEPETKPFLYELRADCSRKVLNYDDALSDMDKAIELILKNLPDRYYSISNFFLKRGNIKQELGNTAGANQDAKKASEYYAKYKVNKTDYDDELPS